MSRRQGIAERIGGERGWNWWGRVPAAEIRWMLTKGRMRLIFPIPSLSSDVYDHRSDLRADMGLSLTLIDRLLDRGIVKGHEKFFLSTAHTDEDIDMTFGPHRFSWTTLCWAVALDQILLATAILIKLRASD